MSKYYRIYLINDKIYGMDSERKALLTAVTLRHQQKGESECLSLFVRTSQAKRAPTLSSRSLSPSSSLSTTAASASSSSQTAYSCHLVTHLTSAPFLFSIASAVSILYISLFLSPFFSKKKKGGQAGRILFYYSSFSFLSCKDFYYFLYTFLKGSEFFLIILKKLMLLGVFAIQAFHLISVKVFLQT